MFARLEERAMIPYRIETLSDLHIGSGRSTSPGEVDLPVIKTMQGVPFVPGSSLKGVLRTETERILRGGGIPGICQIPNVCGKKDRSEDPCPVCLLFGSMNLAGIVRVRDAVADSRRTAIRDGVAIDRKTKKAATGAKYDLEVVPAGTKFSGLITVENTGLPGYPRARLGGILSIIEIFNLTAGSLGHATSRGYGQVSVDPEAIQLVTARDYFEGRPEGVKFLPDTAEYGSLLAEAKSSWLQFLAGRRNIGT